jgi:excisionase family DNA binding protein
MSTKRTESLSPLAEPPAPSGGDQRPPGNRPAERRSSDTKVPQQGGDNGHVNPDSTQPTREVPTLTDYELDRRIHAQSGAQNQPVKTIPQNMPPRAAYSVAETCEMLGISRSTVYRLIARRQLRRVHLGRRALIPASEITRLMELDPPADTGIVT